MIIPHGRWPCGVAIRGFHMATKGRLSGSGDVPDAPEQVKEQGNVNMVSQVFGERTINLGNFESCKFGARVEIPLGGDLLDGMDELVTTLEAGIWRVMRVGPAKNPLVPTEPAPSERVDDKDLEEPGSEPGPGDEILDTPPADEGNDLEWSATKNPQIISTFVPGEGRRFLNTVTGDMWVRA